MTDREAMIDYLTKVRDLNSKIDARGIAQVRTIIEMNVDEVYVDLDVSPIVSKGYILPVGDGSFNRVELKEDGVLSVTVTNGPILTRDDPRLVRLMEQARSKYEAKPFKISKLWDNGSNWVLLGDPGSGKTTVLKSLAFKQATETLASPTDRIPIIVNLRYFTASDTDSYQKFLDYLSTDYLNELGFSDNVTKTAIKRIILGKIQSGKAIFLLDGLDEQRDIKARANTVSVIDDFAFFFKNNYFLVTSRKVGYDNAPLGFLFKSLELNPFTPPQRNEFFKKWVYAVEKREDIKPDEWTKKRADERTSRLIKEIDNVSGVHDLATNPLLCTIIGLLFIQGGALPGSRVDLYRYSVDAFIFNWEIHKRRKGRDEGYLDPDETQAVLEAIANHLHKNCSKSDNRASIDDLAIIASDFLKKELGYAYAEAQIKAKEQLILARDVSGLLIHRGEDQYGFFHLTFQEYLTARYITRERDRIDEYLKAHLYDQEDRFDPRWREVFLLASAHQGTKGPQSGSEFIDAVLRHPHRYEDQLCYSYMFAFECMRETTVKPVTSNQILLKLVGLIKTHNYLSGSLFQLLRKPGKPLRPSEEVISLLVKIFKEKGEAPYMSTAYALGSLNAQSAIPELIKMLADESSDVRLSVSSALGMLNAQSAIPDLIKMLGDKDESVRGIAADALGNLNAQSAIPDLIKMLRDKAAPVRRIAADALGNLNAQSAIPELLKMLGDKDENVRGIAADALGNLNAQSAIPELIKLLGDKAEPVRSSAADALGNLNAQSAIPELLKLLGDKAEPVRSSAKDVLVKFNAQSAIPELIKMLGDKAAPVRRIAADALGNLNAQSAIPELIKMLGDKTKDVRSSAADALGNLNAQSAIPELLKLLGDKAEPVRSSAADALGNLNAQSAIPELLKMLGDKAENVRSSAAYALGNLNAQSAIPELVKTLKDKYDWYTRYNVIIALGKLNAQSAIPELLIILKDKNNIISQITTNSFDTIFSFKVDGVL